MLANIRRHCFAVAVLVLCIFHANPAAAASPTTFAQAGDQATNTLFHVFYAGSGMWRDCNQPACRRANRDWGVDSATNALYLRWTITHDPNIAAVMTQLVDTAPLYPEPCSNSDCASWSDAPAWDAVTLMRESEVLGGDLQALARAAVAFRYVRKSRTFDLGACPQIPYQAPQPSGSNVKTLETDANATKAALLLYSATRERSYLDYARSRYAADRKYFLDPQVPLYTVHVNDDSVQCKQVPRRFFASVNGDMISNGLELYRITHEHHFYEEAVSTALAVDSNLSDNRGIFVDVQGENDVVEPLVEAMYELAAKYRVAFARDWIIENAAAALTARGNDGTFSRFFDGPSQNLTSVWQSNGGLALEIAAGALAPNMPVPDEDSWDSGRFVGVPVTSLPASISFMGSGIALIGTIGETYKTAHVRVFIDNVETFDHTGLWQNPSMPNGDAVLFAWRWRSGGRHTVRLEPSDKSLIAVSSTLHLESFVIPDRSNGTQINVQQAAVP